MLTYKNIVVAENRHKVFVCEMNVHSKGIIEQFMRLTVAENDGCGYSLGTTKTMMILESI